MPTTIVIGTGISATAYLVTVRQYLHSLNQTLGTVGVVGGADLWQQLSHRHSMGQPSQLLIGNLGTGRENKGFAPHQLQDARFMTAGQFSTLIQHYLTHYSDVQLPRSWVHRITKEGSKYLVAINVEGEIGRVISCDNVIFAPGPGPTRPLSTEAGDISEEEITGFGKRVIKGNDFMSPGWKTPLSISPEETTVAVYGGSATAAWAVEEAALRRMKVICWFTRPGRDDKAWDVGVRFRDAFPAGDRNNTVEADYSKVRHVYKLISVTAVPESTKLCLTFEQSDGKRVLTLVDLLIYALGSEHTLTRGVTEVLTPDIVSNLVAFYDKNRAISDEPTLLAIGTEDRSLMIVGSAMSSMAGFGKSTMKLQGDSKRTISAVTSYKEISNTLPEAARPTEGIAMVMAGVEALNEYIPANPIRGGRKVTYSTAHRSTTHDIDFEWGINFNTSNRTQLAVFIAQTTDLSPFAANLAVALIVFFRTQPESVRGLSDLQVTEIITGADAIYKKLAKLNHDLDAQLLNYDKQWGVDRHIAICVDYYTRTPEYKEFWRSKGVGVILIRSAL